MGPAEPPLLRYEPVPLSFGLKMLGMGLDLTTLDNFSRTLPKLSHAQHKAQQQDSIYFLLHLSEKAIGGA